MKRLLFSVAIAAALGAGSFAGFRALNPAERQLSDIELANIEALAEGEGFATISILCDKMQLFQTCAVKCNSCGKQYIALDPIGLAVAVSGQCSCGNR